MKTIWGISALGHDASISVVKGTDILFAAHSERYSRIKNDSTLNKKIVDEALKYGRPDKIVWYEKPYKKKIRQAYSGQWNELFSENPVEHLKKFGIGNIDLEYVGHHLSHAAAGYFTSKFTDAAVVVIDAIGEWDTISIWDAKGDSIKKVKSISYPDSLGLLYSAMTQRVGLKPNEEEYILMGMAAYGTPKYYQDILNDFVENNSYNFSLKENVHCGFPDWRPDLNTEKDYMDLAASMQAVAEEVIMNIVSYTRTVIDSSNLVLMGGVALNCVANEKIARSGIYDNIWIMPNPGDAGSSLGCIAAYIGKQLNWTTPYLGTNIDTTLDINEVVTAIEEDKIIGIANGRAEFGPRSLGNRSLIADPRGTTIKEAVNNIKKRQQFRPFAPIILDSMAHLYFDMPVKTSPYMQFTAKCLYPEKFPAICHVDNSSRVQTLTYDQNPVFYSILEEFYKRTGCPMLLNTSLNIKGEPLVDTWEDAIMFQKKYNVKIF